MPHPRLSFRPPLIMCRLILYLLVIAMLAVSDVAHAGEGLLQNALHALQGGGAQQMPPPASIEIAFSPDGGCTDLVIKAIASAKQSIRTAAYSFTSKPIAKALIDAHQRGVDVELVIDHEQIEKHNHSVAPYLAEQGLPIRVDIVHQLQHDKYMVIDGKTVETGSFNYTASAEQRNSENVMVLWGDPQLAAAYTEDWKGLWDKAESYGGQ
jgi:phosphatidylserine/phosphatidylglycerophosphate/cardiolipin synthase-like enzyme